MISNPPTSSPPIFSECCNTFVKISNSKKRQSPDLPVPKAKRWCWTEKASRNRAVDPSEPFLPLIQEIEDTRHGPHMRRLPQLHGHSITKFLPSESENAVHEAHNLQLFGYVANALACKLSGRQVTTCDQRDSIIPTSNKHLEWATHKSQNIATYLCVLDKNADNKETILEALSWLHHEFEVGNSIQHLVVTGDAKTYTHLINLKSEYGEALRWLVAFPGDFHTLQNYQEVLHCKNKLVVLTTELLP